MLRWVAHLGVPTKTLFLERAKWSLLWLAVAEWEETVSARHNAEESRPLAIERNDRRNFGSFPLLLYLGTRNRRLQDLGFPILCCENFVRRGILYIIIDRRQMTFLMV